MRFIKPQDTAPSLPQPTRRRIEFIRRCCQSFKPGTRIRYHPEFDESKMLESLVLGYCIDGHMVFMPGQLSFAGTESVPTVEIDEPEGHISLNRVDSFQLLIPSNIGEERKLSADSRAALGRNGPFNRYARLSLIAFGGGDNMRVTAEVQKRIPLTAGPHKGHQVALLEVELGSIEEYEPRRQMRVDTQLPATLCRVGATSGDEDSEVADKVMPAVILDVSEFYMRLRLDPPEGQWPQFSERHPAEIGIKPWRDRPLLKLRGNCVRECGCERVFEIKQILKQGRFEPFETLDALELKIALMTLEHAD